MSTAVVVVARLCDFRPYFNDFDVMVLLCVYVQCCHTRELSSRRVPEDLNDGYNMISRRNLSSKLNNRDRGRGGGRFTRI